MLRKASHRKAERVGCTISPQAIRGTQPGLAALKSAVRLCTGLNPLIGVRSLFSFESHRSRSLGLEISLICITPLLHTETQCRPTPLAPLRLVLIITSHSAPNRARGSDNQEKGKPESRKKLDTESRLRQTSTYEIWGWC